MKTRTGNFHIGVRRGWTEWFKDTAGLIAWAQANDLGGIDIGRDADVIGQQVIDAGLKLGSVDLKEWQGMISPDAATRQRAVAANAAYIQACAKLGALNYFIVMLPEKPELPRAENFGYMVDSFSALAPVLEQYGGRIVIEGWPGPGALCCTPEGYRGLFNVVPSASMGVNYDPSHLQRMGIDPIRFLREFIGRVYHVHGKDCALLADNAYEYGHEQPATFAKAIDFGNQAWRYTIPGHGSTAWLDIVRILHDNAYAGMISIELEDVNFNGTMAGEQLGVLTGAQFLSGL